jgi:DNA-binding HxlR family transcriptional regulator
LRSACDDASPTVIQARLDDLRAAGFVALEANEGYALTPLGRRLLGKVMPLHVFADEWAAGRTKVSQ